MIKKTQYQWVNIFPSKIFKRKSESWIRFVQLCKKKKKKKAVLKNATDVDKSKFAKKVVLAILKLDLDKWDMDKLKHVLTNLSNSKSKVDKLDDEKLVPAPFDLSKLSDIAKLDVVKKVVFNAKIKKYWR